MGNNTKKKVIAGIAISIYTIILIFVTINLSERVIVKNVAEASLDKIKRGPDNEIIDRVVSELIYGSLGDNSVSSFLITNIDGESVKDLYNVLMSRMNYKVYAVQKVDAGVYRIGIIIGNNDNIKVATKAWDLLIERYSGGVLEVLGQVLDDLKTDKSQMISSVFSDAANSLESQNVALYFTQRYVLTVSQDGTIQFNNKNGMLSFAMTCAGIPLDAGDTPEAIDEIAFYGFILIILIIIPVVAVFMYRYGKEKDKEKTTATRTPVNNAPKTSQASALEGHSSHGQNRAVVYVKSSQHDNIPFVVHSTPMFIGRDPSSCKIVFAKDAIGVSSRHCAIFYDENINVFILTDLRSTYGTFLMNGEKLIANKPYKLNAGEAFYIGDRRNQFRLEVL